MSLQPATPTAALLAVSNAIFEEFIQAEAPIDVCPTIREITIVHRGQRVVVTVEVFPERGGTERGGTERGFAVRTS